MNTDNDVRVLRALADAYAELAARPTQDERRRLWRSHHALKPTRIPVIVHWGYWNAWAQTFVDRQLQCCDPFLREQERKLRILLFQQELEDDTVAEPWLSLRAAMVTPPGGAWGMERRTHATADPGGAFSWTAPLARWEDTRLLTTPRHAIDEAETERRAERLRRAIGDILTVDVDRKPVYRGWEGDISYKLAELRGLNQLMIDLVESPEQVHALAAFLRDGTLKAQAEAENAGDWSLSSHYIQAMPYADDLPDPQANSYGTSRRSLWMFLAAQEFTLVSPRMFDEFCLQYQLPITENFGLVAYGCCENLTNKIKILRQIKNLRSIAVTPSADLARCAEQIGSDYVISWRPNPTDMMCGGFDPARVRRLLSEGLARAAGTHLHIMLKDVETVEDEPERLRCWVRLARETAAKH